jgi:hypothetical protein
MLWATPPATGKRDAGVIVRIFVFFAGVKRNGFVAGPEGLKPTRQIEAALWFLPTGARTRKATGPRPGQGFVRSFSERSSVYHYAYTSNTIRLSCAVKFCLDGVGFCCSRACCPANRL